MLPNIRDADILKDLNCFLYVFPLFFCGLLMPSSSPWHYLLVIAILVHHCNHLVNLTMDSASRETNFMHCILQLVKTHQKRDIGCRRAHSYLYFLLQKIFDNIMNRDIPWPKVPEEISYDTYDLIDK